MIFFNVALRPNAGYGLLILEVFLDHTQWRTTVGRTPLDEWSARHRDLYLKTHNTHNRRTSMPSVGFKPTISAGERPQTYVLHRAATGAGDSRMIVNSKCANKDPETHLIFSNLHLFCHHNFSFQTCHYTSYLTCHIIPHIYAQILLIFYQFL